MNQAMNQALAVRGVSHDFKHGRRNVSALQQVTLEVAAGEMAAIVGPSGSGKTTLLLACGGLRRPDAGQIAVCDRDVYGMGQRHRTEWCGRHVGFVFQASELIPYLSLRDNVLLSPHADPAEAERLIHRLGLADRREHLACELSRGEMQRTAVCRALAHRPLLLLADEPTGNLDPEAAAIVFETLGEFAASGGGVLASTHDLLALQSTDVTSTYELRQGGLAAVELRQPV